MKVLIIGYYNRGNWGDDLFEYIFLTKLFPQDDVTISNIDDIQNVQGTFDKIIIGGGDVVNEYFLNQENIKTIINISNQTTPNTPILFVGTGIPYPNSLKSMDIGDYFFMRNSTDYSLVKDRYLDLNTFLIPDLGFGLQVNYTNISAQVKKIGMCVPYTYREHQSFMADLSTLLSDISQNYEVHLIPFDTNAFGENDITFIQEYAGNMNGNTNTNITIVNETLDIQQMIEYFKNMDLIIASRFHSVILSIICEKPFVSLYTTRKIDNLRIDCQEMNDYFVPLTKDVDDNPVNINVQQIHDKITQVNADYMNMVKQVRIIKKRNLNNLNLNALSTELHTVGNRQSPPQYITDADVTSLIKKTLRSVLSKLSNKISLRDIDSLFNGVPIISIMQKHYGSNLDSYKKSLTQEILWAITGDPFGPYFYGLFDNVLTNNCINQLKWIINDYYQNYYYNQVNNNFVIVNKNFQRIHRSGWQYIVNNIVLELNNNSNFKQPLIIDTYIDKTFHWNRDFYKSKNIIPYTQDWIGFVHHTYNDYNNNYNCTELFKDPDFISSLRTCRCLIVMTDYLSSQITESLSSLGLSVDVYTLTHPTEYTDTLFDMEAFQANENKQIIQVGNWLRNVFGIYQLEIPKGSIIKGKSVLKNMNSDNYFPPTNFLADLQDSLLLESNGSSSQTVCRNAFNNMHLKGLLDYVTLMEHSVTELDYLDNNAYDTLLSQNIVFLNMVDASAINTLIECIVRNVPILINPIPPVVEMLGKNYPLYYNSFYEASKLLEDSQNIQDAFEYLTRIEKFAFNINEFMVNLKAIISKYAN
jgi:polysaccharide pyruvyl transferase WcaK-like protein